MGEIKTCEQYVLNQLELVESKNENLKDRIHTLQSNYDLLQADYDRLVTRMNRIKGILAKYGEATYFTDNDGKNYRIEISIAQWKQDEKKDFDKLIRFAHIKDKETGLPFDQLQDDAEPTKTEDEVAGTGPETW